ncbi:MAG: hypothetical protein HQK83_11790 [Fibrobacteria bacterium]|nr:hypothetical protein [Fibrobacteria bacterium]
MESSRRLFWQLANKINTEGTSSMDIKTMEDWNFKEQSSGTYIGTVLCPDGFILSLSAGNFENGTQYPKKFGCVLKKENTEICRFDWNAQHRKLKDQRPHFHCSENSSKRRPFENPDSWKYIKTYLYIK